MPEYTGQACDSVTNVAIRTDEGVFFVYDHTVLQKEEDDLRDAIIYFYPSKWLDDDKCALCGQLMGILDFFKNFQSSPPRSYTLLHMRFAIKHFGQYTLALGGSRSLPVSALEQQLLRLYQLFSFYQGSFEQLKQASNGNVQRYLTRLAEIWDTYLPFSCHYDDQVASTFNALPTVTLARSHSSLYLRASHLLQFSQKKEGVLAGCLFFQGKVLCTQLPTMLTWKLLIIRPQQKNFPCRKQSPGFTLPAGVRILTVNLTWEEWSQLNPYKGTKVIMNKECPTQDLDRPPDVKQQRCVKSESLETTSGDDKAQHFIPGDSKVPSEFREESPNEIQEFSKGKVGEHASSQKSETDSGNELTGASIGQTSTISDQFDTPAAQCVLRTDSMEFDRGRCDTAFEDLEISVSQEEDHLAPKDPARDPPQKLSPATKMEDTDISDSTLKSNFVDSIVDTVDVKVHLPESLQDSAVPRTEAFPIKNTDISEHKVHWGLDRENDYLNLREKNKVSDQLINDVHDTMKLTNQEYIGNVVSNGLESFSSYESTKDDGPLLTKHNDNVEFPPCFTTTVCNDTSHSHGISELKSKVPDSLDCPKSSVPVDLTEVGLVTVSDNLASETGTNLLINGSITTNVPSGENSEESLFEPDLDKSISAKFESGKSSKSEPGISSVCSEIEHENTNDASIGIKSQQDNQSPRNLEKSLFEPNKDNDESVRFGSGESAMGELAISKACSVKDDSEYNDLCVGNEIDRGKKLPYERSLSLASQSGLDRPASVSDSFTTAVTSVPNTPSSPVSPKPSKKDELNAKLFRRIKKVAENSVLSMQARELSRSSSSSYSDLEVNLSGLPSSILSLPRTRSGSDSPNLLSSKHISGSNSSLSRQRWKRRSAASSGEFSTDSPLQAPEMTMSDKFSTGASQNVALPHNVVNTNRVPDLLPEPQSSVIEGKKPFDPSADLVKNEVVDMKARNNATSPTNSSKLEPKQRPTSLFPSNSIKEQRRVSFGGAVSNPSSPMEALKENPLHEHVHVEQTKTIAGSKCKPENPCPSPQSQRTLDLYIQGNSHVALVLLLQKDASLNKDMLHSLWKAALPQLAELDYLLKQSLDSTTKSSKKEPIQGYSFLNYDSFDGTLTGNLQQPVTGVDHACIKTIINQHDDFQSRPSLKEMTLRSHAGSMYGHQSLHQETYFQPRPTPRPAPGAPVHGDVSICLDQRTRQRLYKDHGMTVL